MKFLIQRQEPESEKIAGYVVEADTVDQACMRLSMDMEKTKVMVMPGNFGRSRIFGIKIPLTNRGGSIEL